MVSARCDHNVAGHICNGEARPRKPKHALRGQKLRCVPTRLLLQRHQHHAESDVDVIIRLDDSYYFDVSALSVAQQSAFNAASSPATYPYSTFKNDVTSALTASFGSAVRPSDKAVRIAASGNRRSADVIVALQFQRHYPNALLPGGIAVDYGICLYTRNGVRTINYPKQHSQNCTTKHQAASERFKPTVRVVKNMRNRLIDTGALPAGIAPSYFIEGLLYNVPNDLFRPTFGGTIPDALNWVRALDMEALRRLVCANGRQLLIAENTPTSWPFENYDRFWRAIATLWSDW
jgi:hypothetical protein